MKPYYDDGTVTIYHGDCREVLADQPAESVDLILTSPPYNLRRNSGFPARGGTWASAKLREGYASHSDDLPLAEYEDWQRSVLTDLWRVVSGNGAIFYNHKPRIQNGQLWTPLALNPGLPLRQIVIWARDAGMNFADTHYLPVHEWILLFAQPAFRLAAGGSGAGDVWRIQPELGTEHPAPFPLKLANRALSTTQAQTVLDPFMGSGTTLRAAKDLGRRAIGIEIDEGYCELAVKRLGQEVLDLESAA